MHSDCAATHSQVWPASLHVCRQKSPRPVQRAKRNTTPRRRQPPRNNAHTEIRAHPCLTSMISETLLTMTPLWWCAAHADALNRTKPPVRPVRCLSLASKVDAWPPMKSGAAPIHLRHFVSPLCLPLAFSSRTPPLSAGERTLRRFFSLLLRPAPVREGL